MTIKILAVAFLALALTACESSTENANNGNERPAATSPAATPATPATIPTPASSPAASPAASTTQLKAGDKVKVTLNGSASEATVVSVDQKAGKATVKIQGQKEDKTVALSAVSKQ